MPAPIDLTGQPFGKLTAERLGEPTRVGQRRWVCRCKCGGEDLVPVQLLTSGRVEACSKCRGGRKAKSFGRVCIVCKVAFQGDSKGKVCSPECREARRRGMAAGVPALPPPERKCVTCGKVFRATRNLVCCSDECLQDKRRARWRQYWRDHPEKMQEAIAKRKERYRNDPVYREHSKARERRRHRPRTDADRARNRAWWQRNRKRVLKYRREKLANLSIEELLKRQEYARKATRRSKAKQRAEQPDYRDKEREAGRRFKRRRMLLQLAALANELNERMAGESKQKPCMICSQPVVGRHPSAKLCRNPECKLEANNRKQEKYRGTRQVRDCVICHGKFETKCNKNTCSPECRRLRRNINERERKHREDQKQ